MINESSRVLVVDDFELIRVMITSALGHLGIKQVTQAENGLLAWDILDKSSATPFDLVFLDWNMPEMDGLELLEKCRSDARFKSLPIIMVTAESERPYVLKALSSGATDYITKPFSGEVLKQKIESINARLSTT